MGIRQMRDTLIAMTARAAGAHRLLRQDSDGYDQKPSVTTGVPLGSVPRIIR